MSRPAQHDRWEELEARISTFWEEQRDSGRGPRAYVLSHPIRMLRVLTDMFSLPFLHAALGDSLEGRLIRGDLTRRCLAGLTLAAAGACVLAVPPEPAAYREGARKQTLRRKIRAAERAGVRWSSVTDPAEQRELAVRLDRALRVKSDARYRQDDKDHTRLVGQGLWTVATGADGRPLVLAITPHDGELALLQVFITLGEGRENSDARYLLTAAVVDELSKRGVRHLVDGRGLHELTNGLRHFQRMLGFRVMRIRLTSRGTSGQPADGAVTAPPLTHAG